MESLLISLLSGELSVPTLLLLFIIAILTKRFVPWWIYDSLVAELKVYKEQTPDLLDEIQDLFDVIQDEKNKAKATETLKEKVKETRKEIEQTDGDIVARKRVRPKRTSARRGRRNE